MVASILLEESTILIAVSLVLMLTDNSGEMQNQINSTWLNSNAYFNYNLMNVLI